MKKLLSRREFVAATAVALASRSAAASAVSASNLNRITRVAIHPAIGVARVGNSKDAFYFSPEVPGTLPKGPFKDSAGAVAKQAVRFRLFGYAADDSFVAELTAINAEVTWEVAVANTKAAWYESDVAFDLEGVPGGGRRNADVTDRRSLIVEAPPRSLSGAAAAPQPLDGGAFLGMPINLGEVLTDEEGRLIVMPGSGQAYTKPGAPALDDFANNGGWVDDVCDGPIQARVRIDNRSFDADPAWVLCVTPNYAPGIADSIVSAYDVIESTLVEAGVREEPETVFERDIWPIFRRMSDFQWVNEGFFQNYGFGAERDWTSAEWQTRLGDESAENMAIRERIFATFRDPDYEAVDPESEPQLFGDKVMLPPDALEPRQWLALTKLQYRHLKAWTEGRFTHTHGATAAHYEGLAPEARPAALDRAALESCTGGAFHPGIEIPWIIRVPWIWRKDMRFASPSTRIDMTDYGDTLTAPVVMSLSGPLSRLGPGSLTQWMGVPWQADASSCRFGYQRAISPILPSFWPARIPNGVLREVDYRIVLDTARGLDERRAAFARRHDWERFVSAPTRGPILAAMAKDWFKLGMITEQPGPQDGAFPAIMKVETGVGFDGEPAVVYPPNAAFRQLGTFPIAVANSDDNSIRLLDARSRLTVLKLSQQLERPEGLTTGLDGNMYVCCMDGDVVRRVTPAGEVALFSQGNFSKPVGITMDRDGNFYVANYEKNGFVTIVSPDGKSRVLVPPEAGLSQPIGLLITPDNVLLVSWGGSSIARINMKTGEILDPKWITGLKNPRMMAFDTSYRLHVADQLNNAIRRFDMFGTPIPLTIRGSGLVKPFGLAFDSKGLLYITLTGGTLVKRMRIDGNVAVVSDFSADMRNGGGIAFIG